MAESNAPHPAPASPTSGATAFLLGFLGFLVFGGLALMVAGFNKNAGRSYDETRDATRKQWKAESEAAQPAIRSSKLRDDGSGRADLKAADYLPLAAARLAESAAQPPAAMRGDRFIVPGTPTFEAFAARQAAEAVSNAPATTPAPGAPAPQAP